ncbi:MAG: hypothetical protein ACRC8A_04595 [Microcoleaceae cyanobacterium]
MSLNELYAQLNLVILEIEHYDRKHLPQYSSQFSDQVKLRKLAKMFERLAAISEEKADNLDELCLNDSFRLDSDDFGLDFSLVSTSNLGRTSTQSTNKAALATSH